MSPRPSTLGIAPRPAHRWATAEEALACVCSEHDAEIEGLVRGELAYLRAEVGRAERRGERRAEAVLEAARALAAILRDPGPGQIEAELWRLVRAVEAP